MKKEIKSIYKFEAVILLLTILLFFIRNNNTKNVVVIIALGILLFLATLVYKKKKDTNFFRWSAARIVIAVLLFYFILLFILGIFVGFTKTFFSLNPNIWMQGFIPTLIITIVIEQLRYLFIKNNIVEKKAIYILTLLMILFNIVLITNFSTLKTTYTIFVFICITVMPVIAQELLSTYLVCNYGFAPTITFKIMMNMYIYVLPIMPNTGDYIYGAVNVLLPFTIYMVLNKYLKPKEEKNERNDKLTGINISFITIPVMILLVIIIILVSGITKYQMIAIASNSMVPIYERGDAIIFEKMNPQYLETGDVIVFRKDNILIAHRIIKTQENSSKIYFYTKGDANNGPDNDIVKEEEVLGIVRRVVKYIGYPTVWLSELF